MNKCSECGQMNRDDLDYCSNCKVRMFKEEEDLRKEEVKEVKMSDREFIKKLINLFSENTGCEIQSHNCPCNTCFHSQEGDFNHICWNMLLAFRGDYKERADREQILKNIEENLK